ncbi:MAG: hypothetical protein JW767_00110 [Thermoleophilia bacterium]|nr:hypothetical protein [Thermoleophilia bacterium]
MDLRCGVSLASPSVAAGRAPRRRRLRYVAVAALLLVAVAVAGALACGDDGSAPGSGTKPEPPAPSLAAEGDVDGADITGPVAGAAVYDASPQGGTGPKLALLIEDGSGDYDTASVTTTTETTWYEVVDGALADLDAAPDAAALTGRTVAVAFIGPVAESYPVQATAAWVVLLPAAD